MTDSEEYASCASVEASSSPFYAMYRVLKDLCTNNAQFFQQDESESGQRLNAGFLALIDQVDMIIPMVDDVRKIAPLYDFDEGTPGNGYRSFVSVIDKCVQHGVKLSRLVCDSRDSFLFRKTFYMREVEACSHLLASLGTCMAHLQTLLSWSTESQLFPDEQHSTEDLLNRVESINMYCFYGRCLGFQFCESMQKILKTVSICMASFSEIYYGNGGLLARATSSVWTGGKYLLDPELRARRIVNISKHASVDFCKSFWHLADTELMGRLPGMVCPAVAVNKVVCIPPEPLVHIAPDGCAISVPIPTAHFGPAPIMARFLSAVRREGMIADSKERGSNLLPPSPGLIIHCHGGGFVAQSSRSHEIYLRDWACQLKVPMLSIDYSLAPQAPFPRALEEALYAYCWAINNAHIMGSTAEKVILVGDSAGANLNIGVTMKCIELGIRVPNGLFLAYVPVLVSFVPSPSRLLCLMDPLLPFGFMIRCMKAYACPSKDDITSTSSNTKTLLEGSDTESFEEVSESDLQELAAHKSVLSNDSDTLTTVSLASLQSKAEADHTVENNGAPNPAECYMEKYVLDSDTDSEGCKIQVLRSKPKVEENVLFEVPTQQDSGLSSRLGRAVGNIANYMTGTEPQQTPAGKQGQSLSLGSESLEALDSLMQRSASDDLHFTIPRDPYLSPYWASDEVLKQLPTTKIVSVQLDPCLDDCVMFAKKLKKLGVAVSLDVMEGLPHGFLNFSQLSKEARSGSNQCVRRIQELLCL
ncbi:hormone-sensitive lipase isoform X2 [Zootermopsis nevadensis]|uniref:Hormone-sensitive lipase n=1 Tax=Zootermopsis nevadensis TaxID=136037 RepID=A0A067RFD0_ZOONE|nr:hormone-sensitive lipase isoform X2 [Zootermopsis nevadensis]KDR22472.1 Hormone-sensitive lipase [Zootermopsis nevadensis]